VAADSTGEPHACSTGTMLASEGICTHAGSTTTASHPARPVDAPPVLEQVGGVEAADLPVVRDVQASRVLDHDPPGLHVVRHQPGERAQVGGDGSRPARWTQGRVGSVRESDGGTLGLPRSRVW
jgi:hypothetical protein